MKYYMTVSDAIKVLDVSRITMMKWLKEDRFEGACQLNGSPTSAWHIPVEAVEEMRLQKIADYERQIERISVSATERVDVDTAPLPA